MPPKVIVLRTLEEQQRGVLPYQRIFGLTRNCIWFFPNVQGRSMTGNGLREPILIYSLELDLRLTVTGGVLNPRLLMPGETMRLPLPTAHVVETSARSKQYWDFLFLKPFL